MTRFAAVAMLAILMAPVLSAQQGPSITLFNNGQVLVRRTLPLRLPSGVSTHPLALGAFDAATLTTLDGGVRVEGIRYDPAWSEDAILRRHVGKSFWFREIVGRPAFEATLVAMDPERWSLRGTMPEGASGLVFGRPGQLVWPAELVPTAPVADVTFRAERGAEAVRVMYQAMGGSWQAGYRLFVGGGARVEGTATIQAGPLTLANAEVQLLAGDIGVKAAAARPLMAMQPGRAVAVFEDALSQQAVGDARLYTLPQRVTFTPGAQLVLPLFDPVPLRAVREYSVGGALTYWGGGQEPDEVKVPVEVSYRLDRAAGTPFGDLPLPGGSVSVFETDRGGRTQLIGQGAIGHTAPGEELRVRTGTAFDVTARRTQTAFSSSRTPAPTRTIATVTYRVDLQNAQDSAVVVEVREERPGEWSVISSSIPAVRRSSSRVTFPVPVPARGKATLTYSVRVVW
ncbi:MAG: hypothetical protein U0974_14660 [Gemmatimonadales bacterium]|nr:hypothetical protein [Gemmatimonadales bacterium]MDZ4390959.1 hypothetical protein [Gemmatimonadales bacterium]